ncbi:hypothetical protein DPMN_117465 [Dreissena polymorpha]|uniref:Uncharacterized protein n=1 Tax=Dreissena polymorpha TaxID=45954 RepID=A0A9D4QVQ1_DREPO|nr:hypothetical protein DPMN_117465 [Dreissena polymorpha]
MVVKVQYFPVSHSESAANVVISLTNLSEATTVNSLGHHVPARRFPEEVNEGFRAQTLAASTSEPEPRYPSTLYNLLETLQVCIYLSVAL